MTQAPSRLGGGIFLCLHKSPEDDKQPESASQDDHHQVEPETSLDPLMSTHNRASFPDTDPSSHSIRPHTTLLIPDA
jgi:hypothetical protein